MYIATNRQIDNGAKGLKKFGMSPNEAGPNELRLAKVTRSGGSIKVKIIKDELKPDVVEKINDEYGLGLDTNQTWYASLQVAVELLAEAEKSKQHILRNPSLAGSKYKQD